MKLQASIALKPRSQVAVVVDSACDLPPEILEDQQVVVIPFSFNIGQSVFLDKLTISPEKLYGLMEKEEILPRSSVPPAKTVENWLSYLSSHFDSILILTISSGLSGYYNLVRTAAEKFPDQKIKIIDSKNISGAYGLIVKRLLQEREKGKDLDQLAQLAEDLVKKTEILVDIRTLKYMVKGGRVSAAKGLLAKILNLKPIITLDANGKAVAAGKAFSRQQSFRKILKMIKEKHRQQPIHSFAVVHVKCPERAEAYAREIEKICGKPVSFISDVAPVVGVHNGPGAVGICLSYE